MSLLFGRKILFDQLMNMTECYHIYRLNLLSKACILCPEVCNINLFDIQDQFIEVSGYAEQSLHVIITRKWKITYQNYLLKYVRICKHGIMS